MAIGFPQVRRLIGRPLRRLARAPFLRTPGFVIVGTGRSGTGFIASLLSAGGVKTGHEGWWNPTGRRDLMLEGDASWCAAFELDDYRGRAFHQIRDPLLTLRSFASTEVAPHRRANPWYEYRSRFVNFTGDPIVDAVLAVERWLTQSEKVAEWTWRLEDVTAEHVVRIGNRVGLRVRVDAVEKAIPNAHRNAKAKEKLETFAFEWDDLPDLPETDRLREAAARYEYL